VAVVFASIIFIPTYFILSKNYIYLLFSFYYVLLFIDKYILRKYRCIKYSITKLFTK